MTNSDTHKCPICAAPFKPGDICATDITEGPCHAACLEGSPVVDLETGEETGGKVDTYRYSEVMEPAPRDNMVPEFVLQKAANALKPLADAVFNDNGDQSVTIPSITAEQCIEAYWAAKHIRAALSATTEGQP